jgi:hypothetical protein
MKAIRFYIDFAITQIILARGLGEFGRKQCALLAFGSVRKAMQLIAQEISYIQGVNHE